MKKQDDDIILSKDFESQFNKRKTIDFLGVPLEFIDVSPVRDIDSVPIFLAPGWAGDKAMFREVLYSFYRKNRRVLSLVHHTHVKNSITKDGTSMVELRKAEEILAVIEHSGVRFVDAIFYSEGGINGILAANKRPDKFRNIILIDPGGFVIENNIFKLGSRFVVEVIKLAIEIIFVPKMKKGLFRIGIKAITYATKNPIITFKEADAIAKEDVANMLKELHKKGIGTVIMHSTNDNVFPMDKMRKIVNRDMVDYFYSTKGNHFELLVEPRKYVDLIMHVLDVEQGKSIQSTVNIDNKNGV